MDVHSLRHGAVQRVIARSRIEPESVSTRQGADILIYIFISLYIHEGEPFRQTVSQSTVHHIEAHSVLRKQYEREKHRSI